MYPVLIKIGPFSVYSYGFMIMIGFLVATYLAHKNAVSLKTIPAPDQIVTLSLYLLVSGIIGARLLYVVLNIWEYTGSPREIFMLTHGGLVFYGGIISATFTGMWFLKRNRLPFWEVADLLIPYVALAQAIARIGCYLNGCCYGKPTNLPIGLYFPGHQSPIHPTQIYHSLNMITIFLILNFMQTKRHYPGQIFLFYCLLYPFTRFFIEYLRGDNPPVAIGLTISQIISIAIFFISLVIFAKRKSSRPKS